MARRGKVRVPKMTELADKIKSAETIVTQAEQVAAQLAVQDSTKTARELSDILQNWLKSDVPQVVGDHEQLAFYYDSMLKSIMVRMLEALNKAFVALGFRLEMEAELMKTRDLVEIVRTLGHLMVELKKSTNGSGRPQPKSLQEVDALIAEREKELLQLEG